MAKTGQGKRIRYDETAEPLHLRSELDPNGNVIFVEHKVGYPGPGEPIRDADAAFALRHARSDIAARYLRETPSPSLHFRCILADMLEGPRDSNEEYRLEFKRPSCGSPNGSTPVARARAQARQDHIGRYALAFGRHGTKKAEQKFDCSSSYVAKAKRSVTKKEVNR